MQIRPRYKNVLLDIYDFFEDKLKMIRKNNNPKYDRKLIQDFERLTSNTYMGELFKVALLLPNGNGFPPGFISLQKGK